MPDGGATISRSRAAAKLRFGTVGGDCHPENAAEDATVPSIAD